MREGPRLVRTSRGEAIPERDAAVVSRSHPWVLYLCRDLSFRCARCGTREVVVTGSNEVRDRLDEIRARLQQQAFEARHALCRPC